ncbi:MAG: nucleotidyltransferase domain-containing protein [Chitinophagales bacterium]
MNYIAGLTEADLSSLISILRKYPEVEEAFLFGSRAKGNYKKGSDVDIVVKGSKINHESIAAISYELNEETMMPYHFDLLNFHAIANNELIDHINRMGTKIYG